MADTHSYPFSSIAFIGNHVPRQCGIATFTADLCEWTTHAAPELQCLVAVMNDRPEGYAYPERVRFEVNQGDLTDYRRLAEFLNLNRVDVLSVQHEFGIYGGAAGSHLLATLREVSMPIVTTLHTVLHAPNADQRRVMEELCRLSDRFVVMSERSQEFLTEIYRVPAAKTDLIHHGIPDMPFAEPDSYKGKLQLQGREVILTFGLLSPNKGIEYMIDALPEIVCRHPKALYVVLGATHPAVKRSNGEAYRLWLQRRARTAGVENSVRFVDEFVTLSTLRDYLGAADVYVTPYLSESQIVSGTLAYAVGTGKAVVSTPYWYAEELLAERRGLLVPFRDTAAMGEAVGGLLDKPDERLALRGRAYEYGRQMVWPEVARQYLGSFERAYVERLQRGLSNRPHRTALLDLRLPEPNFSHLFNLTDDTGILQHARFSVPNRFEGYATDDNARALIVAIRGLEAQPDHAQLPALVTRFLSFLDYAFDRDRGRFRNFMSFSRQWLETVGSEDSHGRALWSLGIAVAAAPNEGEVGVALELFQKALPAVEGFTSPRSWAFALIGIHNYLKRFPNESHVRRLREVLGDKLYQLHQVTATPEWPWFEEYLTYANARLPQGLLLAGRGLARPEMVSTALRALDWLMREQTAPEGHFSPVGNGGWRRGELRARYVQQPIETQASIEACLAAGSATGDARWHQDAVRAFEWFLGRNDAALPLYDSTTGGCCDGLYPDCVSLNQGAESTLAFLSALLRMRAEEDKRKELC